MKSFILSFLFVLNIVLANANEVARSEFTGFINTFQSTANVSQKILLNLKDLNKKLSYETLEDFNDLYSFALEGDLIVLYLKKENKRVELGMIDAKLIDTSIDQRVKFTSLNRLKTKLIKFKKGIPTPRWSYGCESSKCNIDFDWKRSRKLLIEIEAFDGSLLCLAKGYKRRPELKSGSCH